VGSKRYTALIVEDSKTDLFLIREAIESVGVEVKLHVVQNGEAAIQFFETADVDDGECPDLVILDLNLPKKSGNEVLRHLRANRRCSKAKVLIVSSSNAPLDRRSVEDLGIAGYFTKPSGYAEYSA